MQNETKNVFISHVHEDDAVLPQLKSLLSSRGYQIRDASIDSSKPNNAQSEDYIKSKILAPRIQWASVVIVLISPETHTSHYVNWEIEYAAKAGKKVVGVFVRGGMDSDIPPSLELYGVELYGDGDACGWNSDSVIDAIESEPKPWVNDQGNVRPERELRRYSC
jgi:hypothetical protein